jgi:hypothetical protein
MPCVKGWPIWIMMNSDRPDEAAVRAYHIFGRPSLFLSSENYTLIWVAKIPIPNGAAGTQK